MANHITSHRAGFGPGFTEITRLGGDHRAIGIGLGVLRHPAGYRETVETIRETAWLLMAGRIAVSIGNRTEHLSRKSLFDEPPSAVHVSAGERVVFAFEEDAELTVYESANTARFAPRIYRPEDVPNEHRGAGQVGNACYRFVRTIFDRSNADAAAELVLGEVVTMPGRWSSYPPHHHAQPEIYHYRFTLPQGYGHAELGDAVLKVRQNDTIAIPAGLDHAQCAAPGYGMYYSWVIRHLPDNPYTIPEFTEDHRWTMEKGARFWWPKDVPGHG